MQSEINVVSPFGADERASERFAFPCNTMLTHIHINIGREKEKTTITDLQKLFMC